MRARQPQIWRVEVALISSRCGGVYSWTDAIGCTRQNEVYCQHRTPTGSAVSNASLRSPVPEKGTGGNHNHERPRWRKRGTNDARKPKSIAAESGAGLLLLHHRKCLRSLTSTSKLNEESWSPSKAKYAGRSSPSTFQRRHAVLCRRRTWPPVDHLAGSGGTDPPEDSASQEAAAASTCGAGAPTANSEEPAARRSRHAW